MIRDMLFLTRTAINMRIIVTNDTIVISTTITVIIIAATITITTTTTIIISIAILMHMITTFAIDYKYYQQQQW